MSEPSITKVAGEELPASELNQLLIEALNDYRDFTLGENISANIPVYLKASDSKIYKTSSAADDEKIHSFVGILKEAGSTNDVKKVQVSGKVVGLSGLTAGQKVYLRDTAGEYGAIGTYEKQIGIAISTTSIILRVQMDGVITKNNQTINGVKTFGSIPELPASDPTTDNQAVRKKYVSDRETNVYLGSQNLSDGANTITAGYQSAWRYAIVHIILSDPGSRPTHVELFVFKTGKTSAEFYYNAGITIYEGCTVSVSGTTLTIGELGSSTFSSATAYYYQ